MTFREHSPLTCMTHRILLPHKTEVNPYTAVMFKMCKHRESNSLGKKI